MRAARTMTQRMNNVMATIMRLWLMSVGKRPSGFEDLHLKFSREEDLPPAARSVVIVELGVPDNSEKQPIMRQSSEPRR